MLIFWLKPRASEIVDFFRNFTIDVVGVGDVCSFSQMDTQKHGNPKVRFLICKKLKKIEIILYKKKSGYQEPKLKESSKLKMVKQNYHSYIFHIQIHNGKCQKNHMLLWNR